MDIGEGTTEKPCRSADYDRSRERNAGRGRKDRSRPDKERHNDSERKRSTTSIEGKKTSTNDLDMKDSPGVHRSSDAPRSAAHSRRKRNKTRGRVSSGIGTFAQETPITAVLQELQEDIEEDGEHIHNYECHVHNASAGDFDPYMATKDGGCVYVEHENGFTSVARDHAFTYDTSSSPTQSGQGWFDAVCKATALEVAIAAQKAWVPFADFCHGLLAGISLMQIIVVEGLFDSTPEGIVSFVSIYSHFSLPFTVLFYTLTAFCLISVFDRLDVAHGDWPYHLNLLFVRPRLPWLLVPLYVFGILLALVAGRGDDWIRLSLFNATPLNSSTILEGDIKRLQSWHVLNTLRCTCVVLGWFFMAMWQPEDQLLQHLRGMLCYQTKSFQMP